MRLVAALAVLVLAAIAGVASALRRGANVPRHPRPIGPRPNLEPLTASDWRDLDTLRSGWRDREYPEGIG